MAYVPPHKRQSNSQEGQPRAPVQLQPKSERSFNVHRSKSHFNSKTDKSISYGNKIIYANDSTWKWLAVPLMDDVPPLLRLVPVCVESLEKKSGDKPLTLVKGHSKQERLDNTERHLEHAWASVVETIHTDLLLASQNVQKETSDHSVEETKTTVVARFGKVLFRRNPKLDQDCVEENPVSESYIRTLRRFFYTNVPAEYMEHIKIAVVPELGVQFEEEKELYHVKLADNRRPESTISCKCKVQNDEKKLELYKIELNQVRHMVVDISCLESDVDLRFALYTKRILTLPDEEEQNIKDLISSAILDEKVKGGLKWPLGKANSGGHYSVVGVWHTKAVAYSNSFIRLKMREADRFDFLTTMGEVTREISLKLIGINRNLSEQGSDVVGCLTMLEEALDLIKDHFLAWAGTLVSCSEQ